MKKQMLAVISALSLAGCSMTLPVRGQFENGSTPPFTGTATGYMDGSGHLSVSSADGALKCDGNFVYVDARNGQGTLTCSNGTSGPFRFVSTGTHGTGAGMLNGQRFTFTFGK